MIASIALLGALIGVELARDDTNPAIVLVLSFIMVMDMFSLTSQIEKLRTKVRGRHG